MSIINDALKKVQKGLNPKAQPPQAPLEQPAEKKTNYIYATPPPAEIETPSAMKSADRAPADKNIIKSILAFLCAAAIIAGSGWYLYQQFRNDIPVFERKAKKSFYKFIHKEEVPAFKAKAPEDLKPLAKITIPAAVPAPAPTPVPASAAVVQPATTPIAAAAASPAVAQLTAPVTAPATVPATALVAPSAPTVLNVHGIMSNANGNVALINDQVYQEGDNIDGAKIIKINLKSIVIDIDGTEKTIYVKN